MCTHHKEFQKGASLEICRHPIDVYTTLPSSVNQCACTVVKKASRVLGRVYDGHLASNGINITQLAVLRCMDRRAGEPLARVAEEMEMDRTSLYRAINPMMRDGWLRPAGSRGRTRSVELTTKGKKLLREANKNWAKSQESLIGKFGQRAYDALLSELYRLADCAAPSRPSPSRPSPSR